MKKRTKTIALLTLSAGILVPAAAVAASPAFAESGGSVQAGHLIPEISRAQTADDRSLLATNLRDLGGKIDKDSVRKIDSGEAGTFYTSTGSSGKQICLIIKLAGPDEVVGASCAEPADFAKQGLSLKVDQAATVTSDAGAYLLPANVDISSLQRGAKAGQSKLVMDSKESKLPEKADLKRTDAPAPFTFVKNLSAAG
jgi:hypothetical protein